jgi:hypothetical protein
MSPENLSPRARRWTGNDTTERNHHGLVPFGEDLLEIILRWKTSAKATPRPIGCYRLHLQNLQKAGYLPPAKNGHIRLRFYHGFDDCVYVEPLSQPHRLIIGRFGE